MVIHTQIISNIVAITAEHGIRHTKNMKDHRAIHNNWSQKKANRAFLQANVAANDIKINRTGHTILKTISGGVKTGKGKVWYHRCVADVI